MWNDFRYALRLLCRAPAFTALVLVVMTCGLSISIYMASLTHSLVFKDLPFPDSKNIVVVDKMLHGMRFEGGQLMGADLLAISEQNNSFDELVFYQSVYANLKIGNTSKRLEALKIEPGGLEFTNTLPILGRTLNASDMREKSLDNAVISYKLWRNYFALDERVIGKTMRINNETVTVVGVMPEGYSFPYYTDIWFAFDRSVIKRNDYPTLAGLAQIRENVSLATANQDIAQIMLTLSQQYPDSNYGVSAYVETFQRQALGGQGMPIIYTLVGATFFVLLLSCVNVGGLLFSKALERANETAIRRALGAPRYRLIMQMIWESVIICIVSGLLALLISAWALQLTNPIFARMSYSEPLYWWVFSIDNVTIMTTVILVISTIFVAGFLPCYKATSGTFVDILRQGSRGATNQHVGRLSQLLIKIEVGLSAVILVVAAMFVINTLQSNQHFHQFDENKLLIFSIDLPYSSYKDRTARHQFVTLLENKLETSINIDNVAMGSSVPGNRAWVSEVSKFKQENALEQVFANTVFVNQDLFSVFNIDAMEGRLFNNADLASNHYVAVISDSLAKTMWPDESAIGKRVTLNSIDHIQAEVIGIIKHIDHGTSAYMSAKKGAIYLLNSHVSSTFNHVMVQFKGDQSSVIEEVSKVLFELDNNLPAFNIMSYQRMLDKNITGIMFGSQLFAILAFIALLLAASGIYGVTANSINQRSREIGIRRALGASKSQVLFYFLKKIMAQLMIGVSIGLVCAVIICYSLLTMFLISDSAMLVVFLSVFSILLVVITFAIIVPLLKILHKTPAHALGAGQ